MNDLLLHVLVALPAEAKPLISMYELQRDQAIPGFPVYRRDGLCLIVSGVGKTRAAAATAYLEGINGSPQDAIWINTGIAGHADHAVGEAVLAHQIKDAGTGQCWRPPLLFRPSCPGTDLETLDCPDFDYTRCVAFDMEAGGFYPTALAFSRAELVHCLKIVSDNRHTPGDRLTARQVQDLMEQGLEPFDHLLRQLVKLARQLRNTRIPASVLQGYEERWQFSRTQRRVLRDLLIRWRILRPGVERPPPEATKHPDAAALLQALQELLHTGAHTERHPGLTDSHD